MILQDIINVATDYTDIRVLTNVRGQDIELGSYDGKNSIPEKYNNFVVENISIGGDNEPTLIVEVEKTPEIYLALRLDAIIQDYDPYGYRDAEMNVSMCLDNVENSPVDTIDYLLDIIEQMKEKK